MRGATLLAAAALAALLAPNAVQSWPGVADRTSPTGTSTAQAEVLQAEPERLAQQLLTDVNDLAAVLPAQPQYGARHHGLEEWTVDFSKFENSTAYKFSESNVPLMTIIHGFVEDISSQAVGWKQVKEKFTKLQSKIEDQFDEKYNALLELIYDQLQDQSKQIDGNQSTIKTGQKVLQGDRGRNDGNGQLNSHRYEVNNGAKWQENHERLKAIYDNANVQGFKENKQQVLNQLKSQHKTDPVKSDFINEIQGLINKLGTFIDSADLRHKIEDKIRILSTMKS